MKRFGIWDLGLGIDFISIDNASFQNPKSEI